MTSKNEERPASDGAPHKSLDDDITSMTSTSDIGNERCRHCGHPIWAPESVQVGLGRECRKAVA